LSGVSKYFVDQREKHLSKLAQQSKDSLQGQRVQQFETTIKSLETELSTSKKEIVELGKRTVPVNVYKQLIRTATASVEVIIQSNDDLDNNYMDSGGYLAFLKGQDLLLAATSTNCTGKQIGNGRVRYKGVFNLDAASEATQKPVLFLKESEYVQIGFAPMPEKMIVLAGKAIVTINNAVRLELDVPPQKMAKDFIIIPDIQKYLNDFKE